MRKTAIKPISFLLAVVMVALSLCGCGNVGALKIFEDGESKYRIVYESDNREASSAATVLGNELKKKAQVTLDVVDDRTEVDKKIPEILVGRTNRGTDLSFQREMRFGSYVVVREKKNVYILGAGEGVLNQACRDFASGVIDAGGKISGKGEILSNLREYTVDTVNLNGVDLTEYTVYLPETGDGVKWEKYVGYVEDQLAAVTGYMLTTATYTDANDLPKGPAVVLVKDEALTKWGYAVTLGRKNTMQISVGSDSAAMALTMAFTERLENKKAQVTELSLAEESGKVGENTVVPLENDADLRVMCFNVYGNDDHKSLMSYVTGTAYAYAADFICMQEFYDVAYDTVGEDLEKAGYGVVGDTFTEVSPTALAHKDDDENYQKFAQLGATSNTPIYYKADVWEPVESGAYLFYWMNRWHCSNTKSIAYGVFRHKTTGEQVAIVSTHFPLMVDKYQETNKDGRDYAGYTDKKEGAEWRYGAAQELLLQLDILREKYPGILTVLGGDLNALATEKSIASIESNALLSNGNLLAPADKRDAGGSFHDYNKADLTKSTPIDHLFVTEDVATVLRHRIVADALTVQGTDHCPIVLDIARK